MVNQLLKCCSQGKRLISRFFWGSVVCGRSLLTSRLGKQSGEGCCFQADRVRFGRTQCWSGRAVWITEMVVRPSEFARRTESWDDVGSDGFRKYSNGGRFGRYSLHLSFMELVWPLKLFVIYWRYINSTDPRSFVWVGGCTVQRHPAHPRILPLQLTLLIVDYVRFHLPALSFINYPLFSRDCLLCYF